MSEPLQAGIFKPNSAVVRVRIWAWQEPVMSEPDQDDGLRRELIPRNIGVLVERECYHGRLTSTFRVLKANGDEINKWERRKLPKWLQQRVVVAIAESLRLLGRNGRAR